MLAACLLAFAFLGTRGLWEPDEGRYVEVAREMVLSGDWVVPTLHGVPHLSKPPLTYWAIALPLRACGNSEWAARLYLGLAFLAAILLLARWGEEMWGDPRGRWAGIVYGSSLLPFVAASVATTDTLLALWEFVAMYSFWRGWRSCGTREARWYVAGWAAWGLAFLTKGPPGLLPLLGWAAFVLVGGRGRTPRRWSWLRPGVLFAFALVALPWFLVLLLSGRGVFGYLFLDEFVRRVATGVHHRNAAWSKAVTVYGPALLLGGLPWSLAWPRAFGRWMRGVRARASCWTFLAAWFVAPLLVLVVARSRLAFYAVPLFAPLSLAVAGSLAPCPGASRRRRWTALPLRHPAAVTLGAIVLLLGLRAGAAAIPVQRDGRALAREIRERVGKAELAGVEIFPVGWTIHGLGFYLGAATEEGTGRRGQGPTWWSAGSLAGELREVAAGEHRHLLVVSPARERWARRVLQRAGASCRDLGPVRAGRLLLCGGQRPGRRPPVRILLGVAGSTGLGDVFRFSHRAFETWERDGADLLVVLDPATRSPRPSFLAPSRVLWRLWEERLPAVFLRDRPGHLAATSRGPLVAAGSSHRPAWTVRGGEVRVGFPALGRRVAIVPRCHLPAGEEPREPGLPVVLVCREAGGARPGAFRARVAPGGAWRRYPDGLGVLELGPRGARLLATRPEPVSRACGSPDPGGSG